MLNCTEDELCGLGECWPSHNAHSFTCLFKSSATVDVQLEVFTTCFNFFNSMIIV